MLRIGEFSRLSGVSVKTLRFYSDRGLLRPSTVDPWTGYRLYSHRQLEMVARIRSLRDLGFGLDKIAAILDNPRSLRTQLLEQRDALAREAATASRRLARIERALKSRRDDPFAIRFHRTSAFHALSVRDRVSEYAEIDALFEAAAGLTPRGARVRGRVAAWYPHSSQPNRIDAEALLVVDEGCPRSMEVPARDVISALYSGDDWEPTFARLTELMCEEGLAFAGPKLERLLGDDLVEVQFPVKKETA